MKFYLTSQKYANSNLSLSNIQIDQISKAYLPKLRSVCTVTVWMPSPSKIKNSRYTGVARCHDGSIMISDTELLRPHMLRKLLGKPFDVIVEANEDYPKVVVLERKC